MLLTVEKSFLKAHVSKSISNISLVCLFVLSSFSASLSFYFGNLICFVISACVVNSLLVYVILDSFLYSLAINNRTLYHSRHSYTRSRLNLCSETLFGLRNLFACENTLRLAFLSNRDLDDVRSSFARFYKSEAKEKKQAEMAEQVNRVSISPTDTLPAEVIAIRANNYKQVMEQKQSALPSVAELFKSRLDRFKKIGLAGMKNPILTTPELVVLDITGNGVVNAEIPIVEKWTEPSMDTRMSSSSRAREPQVVVAATEIIVDGYASTSSDVTVGFALHDKRHTTIHNSFKGACAMRASGIPSHVVFYPKHRVAAGSNPNDTLAISAVSHNNDMREGDVLARIFARNLYARVASPEQLLPTKHLLDMEFNDAVEAKSYVLQHESVVAQPRQFPKVNLSNFVLPGPKGVVKDVGHYKKNRIVFETNKSSASSSVTLCATRESVEECGGQDDRNHLDSEEEEDEIASPVRQQAQAPEGLMAEGVFEAMLATPSLKDIPETMRTLRTARVEVPANVTEGTRLITWYLNDLHAYDGVHVRTLKMITKIPGSLRVKMHCSVPPTSGIGLFASYIEGNESEHLGTLLGRLIGPQHIKWNPAIEPYKEFLFKPFSCCDWWNMHYLGNAKYAPVFVIGAMNAWDQPCKAQPNIVATMYFEPDVHIPPYIADFQHVDHRLLRKEIGIFSFQQSQNQKIFIDPSLGKAQISGVVLSQTFASCFLSMCRYYASDIDVELTHLSSPMLGATFTIAYVPGNMLDEALLLSSLEGFPHCTFTFKASGVSTIKIRFKKEHFPTLIHSDRWIQGFDETINMSGAFVLFVRDSVSSGLDGNLSVSIALAASGGQIEMNTFSAGYPSALSRVSKLVKPEATAARGLKGSLLMAVGSERREVPKEKIVKKISFGKNKADTANSGNESGVSLPDKGKAVVEETSQRPRKTRTTLQIGQAPSFVSSFGDFTNVEFEVARWNYGKVSKYTSSYRDVDVIEPATLTLRLDGSKATPGFEIVQSPLVRLLKNCAWFKGTISWKVILVGSSEYPLWRRCSINHIHAHESSLSTLSFFQAATSGGNEQVAFSRYMGGPVDGFANMAWSINGSVKFPKLAIDIGTVHEYTQVCVMAKFEKDVVFSGQQKATAYAVTNMKSHILEIHNDVR